MKKYFCIFFSIIVAMSFVGTVRAKETITTLNTTSDRELWSSDSNFNSDWEGLQNYDNVSTFYIENGSDLAALMVSINKYNKTYKDKTVILRQDIDLSSHLWDMRGGIARSGGGGNVFSGNFDGAGHTISGMVIDYDNAYIGDGSDFGGFGLFACLYQANISNLTMKNSFMNIGYFVASFPLGAGIVSGQSSGSTFENINVLHSTILQKYNKQGTTGYIYFGGIVGAHYQPFTRFSPTSLPSTYKNCTVDGLQISYTNAIDQNWKLILGFGGIVGGDVTYNPDKKNEFQTRITDCKVNNLSISRGEHLDTAFAYEAYGGVIGYMDQPTIIEGTHVFDIHIDITKTANKNGETFGITGPASAMVGGIIGYGEVNPQLKGVSRITSSSAQGKIKAAANTSLLPVYVGGLMGGNEGGIDCVDNYTQLDYINLKDNKNTKLVYGNLFGFLKGNGKVQSNIFNNHDYIADEAKRNEPSVGYIGEKLSTFKIAGEDESVEVDLSQNWGILKYILTEKEKGIPLDYVQCEEKTSTKDFYDFWTIDYYEHTYLTQDEEKEKVTFERDSKHTTFLMDSQITSKSGGPTWKFMKDILVLPKAQYYMVTYLPGSEGNFKAQEYKDLSSGDKTPSFIGDPLGNEGWIFKGWDPQVSNTVTNDMTYTAQWERLSYIVDYKFVSKSNPEHISTPPSEILFYGELANKPTLTGVADWKFEGWFIDEECIELFDFNTKITNDITLYGRWMNIENSNPVHPSIPNETDSFPPSIDTSDVKGWKNYFAILLVSVLILCKFLIKRMKIQK